MKRPRWQRSLPKRLAARSSLFDMLPEVVLDLRTGWNNEPAGRSKYWTTLEERKPTFVIGSLPQYWMSTVKRVKSDDVKRLKTDGLTYLI